MKINEPRLFSNSAGLERKVVKPDWFCGAGSPVYTNNQIGFIRLFSPKAFLLFINRLKAAENAASFSINQNTKSNIFLREDAQTSIAVWERDS